MGGIIGSYGQSDLMRGNSGKQQEAGDLYQRSRGQNGMEGSFDVRGGSSEPNQNNGFGRVNDQETNHGYGYVKNSEELKRGYGVVGEQEKARGYGVVGEQEKARGYGVLSSGGERRGYGVTPGDGYKRGYGRLGGVAGSSGGVSGVRRAPSETMQRDKMMGMGGGPAGSAGFSGGNGFSGGSRSSGGNIRPVIKPNF